MFFLCTHILIGNNTNPHIHTVVCMEVDRVAWEVISTS